MTNAFISFITITIAAAKLVNFVATFAASTTELSLTFCSCFLAIQSRSPSDVLSRSLTS